MDPPLATRPPLEVLDGIGDVDVGTFDARCRQRVVKKPACRTDKRPSGTILGVPRLLAHENDPCPSPSLAKDCLGGVPEQVAVATSRRLFSKRRQRCHSSSDVGSDAIGRNTPRVATAKTFCSSDSTYRRPGVF